MPATRSPTGRRRARACRGARARVARSSPRPRSTCSSRSSSRPPREPVAGDRVGDRAQVVRADRDAHQRPGVEQPARERLEVAVALGLVGEHRHPPAVLARLGDLVVPVGALDQPHRQRRRARRVPRPGEDPLDERRRFAQVGLDDDPGGRAVAELRLVEQLERQLDGRLERVERLHVDVQVRAELACARQQRAQPRGSVGDAALRRLRRAAAPSATRP